MEFTVDIWWLALPVAVLPLLWWLLRWWNEIWYVMPLKIGHSNTNTGDAKLPPGCMGFPLIGELLTFLWYFKFLRRPDDFINSKRHKYGDGVGLYRTYLFGSPSIIACFPSVNKLILHSSDAFIQQWPTIETLGVNSLVAAEGKSHARLKRFMMNAINRPDTLRRIAFLVQPRIVAALQSWNQKGRIIAQLETRKVTFENIGRLFGNLEPGPLLDSIDQLFIVLKNGFRANPWKFPGTAFQRAIQCRRKLSAIFRAILEKRKKESVGTMNDLMDGLMQIEDEEGNKLSDDEVVDNIVSLISGGYESTSLASMWAIYYLAKYPIVLDKLREENMAISKSKNGEYITSDDVSKMKYTNKVVEEIIRLANIAAFVFRFVTKDFEYEGYKIPKGWRVIVWLRYLHTNSENFDDPMCFNPDRWNKPAKPGTNLVFGAGQRHCPGFTLARMTLAIFLHYLSVGYKWELLNPDAGMVYLPHPKPIDGVEVSFSKI